MRTRQPNHYTNRHVGILVGVLVAVLSGFVWPLHVRAAPALSIEPPRGRCTVNSPPLTVRGAGFPSGLRVTIVDFGTADDPQSSGFPIGEGTVGADGTFSVDGVRFRCPAELVEGQQHTIWVLPTDTTRRAREDVLASVNFTTSAIPTAVPPDEGQCFAETGQCVAGRFLAYWRYNGGLARHGYPLTDERRERLEDGREYLVQYFERTRLEYHPENAPPYDVLIGQFGRRSHPADPPVAPLPRVGEEVSSEVRYFPETGHNLGRFRYYWTERGGAELFGLPIGEEVVERLEDGNEYTVQYFERARLEWHPGTPATIVVGQLGRHDVAESAPIGSQIGRIGGPITLGGGELLKDWGIGKSVQAALRELPPVHCPGPYWLTHLIAPRQCHRARAANPGQEPCSWRHRPARKAFPRSHRGSSLASQPNPL